MYFHVVNLFKPVLTVEVIPHVFIKKKIVTPQDSLAMGHVVCDKFNVQPYPHPGVPNL